jgi:hypothetical protein
MVLGSSTSVIAVVVTATVMMVGAVQAADDAKYPDWKGQWTRWFPPGSVPEPNGGLTAGGQPSHDQTKPWGQVRRPRSRPSIKRSMRKALPTRPTAERAISLTILFAACPEGWQC